MDARKPLMESRDERVTVRMTTTQRTMFADAARAAGEEESRYIRRCAAIGHRVIQSMPDLKATVA